MRLLLFDSRWRWLLVAVAVAIDGVVELHSGARINTYFARQPLRFARVESLAQHTPPFIWMLQRVQGHRYRDVFEKAHRWFPESERLSY
jgi:hypothetical protein